MYGEQIIYVDQSKIIGHVTLQINKLQHFEDETITVNKSILSITEWHQAHKPFNANWCVRLKGESDYYPHGNENSDGTSRVDRTNRSIVVSVIIMMDNGANRCAN